MIAPFRIAEGDAPARERIRTSLGESLIVEASAGTGKTSELVQRLLSVLQSGAGKIQNIVAVTFTHKAAGELKLRLRQRLDEARQSATDPEHIANLEDALKHLEEAVIGTIHGFCAQILRERPVEAVVDPAFEELSAGESSRIYGRAFRAWLQQRLDQPSPGLRRALVRLAWRDSRDAPPPLDQLKMAGWTLIDWRDFPAPWRRPLYDRQADIDALVECAARLGEMAAQPKRSNDNLFHSLKALREFNTRLQRSEAAAPRDYDTLEGLLPKLKRDLTRNFRKGSSMYSESAPRERIVSTYEMLCGAIANFKANADADLASTLRDEMASLVDSYLDLKRRAGKLDFTDLLILVRDLVRSNHEVRAYLQQRYSHIFVDEFQDTDPLQAEILILLSSGDPNQASWLDVTPTPGKLFLVGDPKQSIYKFRGADLTLYRDVCEALIDRGVGHVKLTRSFRSIRPIQEFVNSAFALEMTGDAAVGQAHYSPLDEGAPPIAGQPSLVALPAPRPYGRNAKIAKYKIEECLPETIAAYVEWLLRESGWQVRDTSSDGQLVPLQNQHIALLFRRFMSFGTDMTRDYVRAFEARDIPHLLVGSKSFHAREEIETMRAALSAIEWPDDELSVFATLKGSLFAVPDSMLLRYRHQVGRLHPFAPNRAQAPEFAPVREALDLIGLLHRARNRQPIAETVNQLLDTTRAHAGFAFRPAGHQVLANVYRIVTMARNFELTGGISFRAFVEELAEQAERPGEAEAPVLEEGAEGVRLMTVHNAKGLEFPIVILADMTAKICSSEPDRYINARQRLCATRLLQCAPLELLANAQEESAREQAEGVRIAYVAATRARDLLVVPAIGDEPYEGWLGPLNRALYPSRDTWRKAEPAPGCPPFGAASLLDRPMELLREGEISVHPGLHGNVVWWDPSKLRLNVQPKMGLINEHLLTEGDSDGLRRFHEWRKQRDQTIQQGGRKSFDIVIASEGPAAPSTLAVETQSIPKQPDLPSGRRFGTLVHAIIRDVDLSASDKAIRSLAASHSRSLGAPPAETEAAATGVAAVLAHPLLQSARQAVRCMRESPVTLPLADGRILEGTIDLAYLDGDTWTIVDFKTDADVAAKRSHYIRQLQWYAAAFSKITGKSVRAILFAL